MNLFKIETRIKDQGAEVSPSASLRTGGRESVVNCEAGFTLIEMIVVVVIIGILVVLAYATLRTPNEQIACHEVYSKLQLAKMQAVSTGFNVTVDVENDVLAVMKDVDWQGEVDYDTSIPAEPTGWLTPLDASGIDFDGSNGTTVTFTSKGMVTNVGYGVYLKDVDNTARICAVSVLTTGLVKIAMSNNGGASWR